MMKNCPTWLEFELLDVTNTENQGLIDLYKSNRKLWAISVLGLGKNHGLAPLCKTKNDDYPNRLALEFIERAKKTNKLINV